ncbi:hypothetical protein EVAR_64872_1 [Eumeta japonica]|uniref:Uncharacterized protein n=1 Tax=Eumeta variegata TaxID=151549 RepID=A0A4C1ZJY2_EUMVA|nr:hypothetical protein EVAR_64872_1 [Eumeta japonica]
MLLMGSSGVIWFNLQIRRSIRPCSSSNLAPSISKAMPLTVGPSPLAELSVERGNRNEEGDRKFILNLYASFDVGFAAFSRSLSVLMSLSYLLPLE